MTDDAPLYQRIARRLETRIGSGELRVGDRLPSERQIAESHRASRMTARSALKALERSGLIETRVGRGSFVANSRLDKQLRTLAGFTEEMRRAGRTVSSMVLDAAIGAADDEAAAALNIAANTLVHRLVRVRMVDGDPVAVERTEIPLTLAPGLLDRWDFASESLYRVLRDEYGIVPSEAQETACAALPEAATAAVLRLSRQEPVLKFTRCTFGGDGRPLEYVRSMYRGDSFTLRVRLTLA